jgi:hypothetical protein
LSPTKGSSYPTYDQARKEAGLPARVTAEELLDRDILITEWIPSSARIPETGAITEGFLVTLTDVAKDETVEFFCGQQVLVKELKALKPPFSTVIRKNGRTYVFS